MAEIVRFPNRTEAYEQAAAWLARVDQGLSAEDEAELKTWLEEQAQNREAFLELAAFWDEADMLSELADLFPLERADKRSLRPRFARKWVYAGTGAAAIALAAGGALVTNHVTGPAAVDTAAEADYNAGFSTTVGTHATEELPDGSVVTLNTNTELDIDYTRAERSVFLQRGEAHFDVAPEPGRPFNVHVGDRVVEAIGTAFNVRFDQGGKIEVTVTAGEVRVSSGAQADLPTPQRRTIRAPQPREPGPETTLVEGEVAILDRPEARDRAEPQVLRLEPVDIDIKLAWQRGMLIFRGEPLDAMLDEVSRYTTTEFVLDDRRLADVRVGGYFRAGDIEGLLAALRENFRIESERVGEDRIALRPAR